MTRHPDWRKRLHATVIAWEGRPFTFGESDCACFAAAAIEAVSGRDAMGSLRGSYSTRLQAAARIRGRGHASLKALAGAQMLSLGAVAIDPRAARVGDIGCTADDVLAVRLPRGFVARGIDGTIGITDVTIAWAL